MGASKITRVSLILKRPDTLERLRRAPQPGNARELALRLFTFKMAPDAGHWENTCCGRPGHRRRGRLALVGTRFRMAGPVAGRYFVPERRFPFLLSGDDVRAGQPAFDPTGLVFPPMKPTHARKVA